jgi:glycosyltransferase involved in cell wall biosynthesis
MKILHVVPTYLPAYRYGGPIQSVHALNKYLVRAGAEVTVYTTAIDGPDNLNVPISSSGNLKPVDMDGVKVFYFKPGFFRSWFYSPAMRRVLKETVKDFDIVHITSVFLAASTLGARAAFAADKPYIISPRGSLMREPLHRKSSLKKSLYIYFLERDNLRKATGVHFTTGMEREEYEAAGLPLRRAITIPNGLDPESLPAGDPTEFRKRFGIAADKKIILFLGRINWKKGLDTLIPAFAKVSRELPEAVLVLAGGDEEGYKSVVEKMAADNGVGNRIVFAGELNRKDASSAYRSASMFVLSSYAENFAITVAEAMYFGVPVVVTEGVGLASLVRQHEAGLVTRKDDVQFAAAMIELLRDPRAAGAMGERGKALAASFSYEKVAQDFLSAYKEIIG